jgi:hypothetical protein
MLTRFSMIVVSEVVIVIVGKMNIKFHPVDISLLLGVRVKVITLKTQFGDLAFDVLQVDAEIDHRPEKHIAADAAKNIEIENFHESNHES